MIANKLKIWRKNLGISQNKAAKKLGVPVRTLQNWEQGTRRPQGLALKVVEAKCNVLK